VPNVVLHYPFSFLDEKTVDHSIQTFDFIQMLVYIHE